MTLLEYYKMWKEPDVKRNLAIYIGDLEGQIKTLKAENTVLKQRLNGLDLEINTITQGGYLWK